ncbi:hypothetical protein [Cupriavidus pauculus]|uniref:hypothetical protein n=1 Tax=Cupriavidus pauculus TaxID=82633 RepID=UPI001D0C62B2|nr:hypothetical protein [Cupriavidus pauculus]
MGIWTEVTQPSEIASLNRQLKVRLTEETQPGGRLRIGTPAGHFVAPVRIAPAIGGKDLWIFCGKSKENSDFLTLVGRRDSNEDRTLLIDLQFNFPKGRFDRMKGGAFVKDSRGRAFLAHRGIATRGKSRVPKDQLLHALNWKKMIVADSSAKPYHATLLVVAALDDENLLSKVLKFAVRMRDAANFVVDQSAAPPSMGQGNTGHKGGKRTALDMTLSKYRDEFSGSRTVKRKGEIVVQWTHGRIVSALSKALTHNGRILQSKAADLVLIRRDTICIFEVKKFSDSQSIYTAIGQLIFNGRFLEQRYPSYNVRKFLVLPDSTEHETRQKRCKELGFELVTFEPASGGFTFDGLPSESQ